MLVHADVVLASVIIGVFVGIEAVSLALVYVDVFKTRPGTRYGELASRLALKHVVVHIAVVADTSS